MPEGIAQHGIAVHGIARLGLAIRGIAGRILDAIQPVSDSLLQWLYSYDEDSNELLDKATAGLTQPTTVGMPCLAFNQIDQNVSLPVLALGGVDFEYKVLVRCPDSVDNQGLIVREGVIGDDRRGFFKRRSGLDNKLGLRWAGLEVQSTDALPFDWTLITWTYTTADTRSVITFDDMNGNVTEQINTTSLLFESGQIDCFGCGISNIGNPYGGDLAFISLESDNFSFAIPMLPNAADLSVIADTSGNGNDATIEEGTGDLDTMWYSNTQDEYNRFLEYGGNADVYTSSTDDAIDLSAILPTTRSDVTIEFDGFGINPRSVSDIISDGSLRWAGRMEEGSTGIVQNPGTGTYYVDGVELVSPDRGVLYEAFYTTAAKSTIRVESLNLATWSAMYLWGGLIDSYRGVTGGLRIDWDSSGEWDHVLIPCPSEDGMLDIVTGTVYTNSGTETLRHVYDLALDDGSATVSGEAIANMGDKFHGPGIIFQPGCPCKILQTDSSLLDNTFWSFDGSTFDEKSFSDFYNAVSNTNNNWFRWDQLGTEDLCHLVDTLSYSQSKVLSETEYNQNVAWLGSGSCGGGVDPFSNLDFSESENSHWLGG